MKLHDIFKHRALKPLEDTQETRIWMLKHAVDADESLYNDLVSDMRKGITIEMALQAYESDIVTHS